MHKHMTMHILILGGLLACLLHFRAYLHIDPDRFVSRFSGCEEDGRRWLAQERFQPIRQRYDKRT